MAYNPGFNDGAWDIPGFTAQNIVYPPSTPVNGTPVVPYATVVGYFMSPSGKSENGFVTLTPSVRQFNYNGMRVELDPIKVQIDMTGHVNVNIPAPTSATVPNAWTWDVRVRVGPSTSDYPGTVIAQGTTLDITTLTP